MRNPTRDNQGISLADFLEIVSRRRLYAIVTALLVMAGVGAYIAIAKNWYRARALVAIDVRPGESFVDSTTRVREELRTAREVLLGEPVFGKVVSEFHLIDPKAASPQRAAEEVRSRMKLELDGETAIYIGYEGRDPRQVSDVANRMAELLSEETSEGRELRLEEEAEVSETEIDRLREKLSNLDKQIETYKQGAVEELPERIDANLKTLEDLQAQSRSVALSIANEDSHRAGVVTEMADLDKQGVLETEKTARPLSENARKLAASRLELERLLTRYRPDYPSVITLKGEISSLETLVNAEPPAEAVRTVSPGQLRYTTLKADLESTDRRLASLRQQKSAVEGQIAAYRTRVNASPRHEQALSELKREHDVTQVQYEEQLTKQSQARHTAQIQQIEHGIAFRIVEPAMPPLDPYSPNRLRLLLVGLAAALGAGLGAVFLVEQLDSTFKDVEDVQSFAGLPVLAVVPTIARARSAPSEGLVVLKDPKSVPAEQFHVLATRLRSMSPANVFTVASSAGGEGKTFTSINLALALARTGAKVLLIDADLRRPRVHLYLGLHAREGQGLAAMLADPELPMEKSSFKVGGLTVLPGLVSRKNPLLLLASPSLQLLISRFRREFQFVVIDSTPILPIADGIVLGGVSDHVVLVVRARRTTRAVLKRALDSMDQSKLAGVVLNDVDMRHSKYSYVYRYYEDTYLRGA